MIVYERGEIDLLSHVVITKKEHQKTNEIGKAQNWKSKIKTKSRAWTEEKKQDGHSQNINIAVQFKKRKKRGKEVGKKCNQSEKEKCVKIKTTDMMKNDANLREDAIGIMLVCCIAG